MARDANRNVECTLNEMKQVVHSLVLRKDKERVLVRNLKKLGKRIITPTGR